jgi:hypothetical protein
MTDPRMVKALVWDRGAFEIAVGKGEQAAKQTVSGWVDQQKLRSSRACIR